MVQQFSNGKPVWAPVTAELNALLAPLAELCGADLATVAAAAASLPEYRQQEFPRNGLQVAAYLQRLGMEQRQLARLLERCPELLSWPAGERAGVLFGQLMGLGLSAAGTARCFEYQPGAAGSPSFVAAIGVLADMFASGSRDGQAGPQLLACLLRKQPAAVSLIMCSGSCLQERIACFLGELGFSPQELAARLQQQWALLTGTPEQLAALEAMLQRELGVDRRLFCKLLTRMPRVVGCSLRTVQRILALVAMSGDGTWCSGHPADVVRNLHVADAEPTRLCLAIALPAGAWPGAGAACSSHCTPAAFGQHCRVAASPGGVAALRRGRSNSCGAQQRSNALPGLAGTGAAGQPAGVAAQHGAVTGWRV